MPRFFSLASAVCTAILSLHAAALPAHQPRAVSDVSSAELSSYTPFTQFARAAYCAPTLIQDWTCAACSELPGFQPVHTGGDGDATQFYFVGYWPSQHAVVVAHQGTDPTQFLAVLTDIDILLTNLDGTLFPGVPSNVQVHEGFAAQHAQVAPLILTNVKSLLESTGATNVFTIGHSLGGALAELDGLFFTLNLPSSVHVKAMTYGTPRVGNPAWAAYFDSKVSDFKRINHASDPIPIVPGRALGFQHPHGEIHILDDDSAVACPGDDDATDAECTIATVPNIFVGDIIDHLGPYEGIFLGAVDGLCV